MPRTSIPAGEYRRIRPWRRQLIWAALLTLVVSALYFSVAGRTPEREPVEVR